MKALIQRVTEARVTVDEREVGAIGKGLLVFLGVETGDTQERCRRLAERVLTYRVFPDDAGRMNLNVADAGGGLLVVSQFTLAADTTRGNRPGFSRAAVPEDANRLYEAFLRQLREQPEVTVASGRFAADMQVALINDGPVTFLLET